MAYGILVPHLEIKPRTHTLPSANLEAVRAPSPNHWTAREFLKSSHFEYELKSL